MARWRQGDTMSEQKLTFIGPYEILEKIDSYIVGDISSHRLRRWAQSKISNSNIVHEDWLCDDMAAEEKYILFWNVLMELSKVHGTRSELKERLNNWATLLIRYYQLIPGVDLDSLD